MEHPIVAREMAVNAWLMAALAFAVLMMIRTMPNVKPGAKALALAATGFIAANAVRQSLMFTMPAFLPWMSMVPPLCMVVIGVIMLFRPDENRYVWLTSYVALAASALMVIGVLIR